MTTSRIITPVVTLAVSAVFGLAACSPATPTATTTTTTTTTATAAPSTSEATSSASSSESAEPSESASPSTTSTASTSSSSSGETQTVSGDGYSFELPADWVAASLPSAELAYKAAKPTNGFFTNMITSQHDPGGVGLEEGTAGTAKQAEEDGSTNVRTGTTTLGGETATTIDQTRHSDGTTVQQRQVLCIHDGKLFIVTVSMHAGATDSEMDDVVDPITTSWEWM